MDRKIVSTASLIVIISISAGVASYILFKNYLLKPTELPIIEVILRKEVTQNGTKLTLVVRNVQNIPVTWEELSIYLKKNEENWEKIKAGHSGVVLGGQEVSLGYFSRGDVIQVKIVYQNVVIYSETVEI